MVKKVTNYIKESVEELRKVNWLSFQGAKDMTISVILFSLTIAAILGILDMIFVKLIVR